MNNKLPENTTLYERFKKCLQCHTYNPESNTKCYNCGFLFYREAEEHELEDYNKRYQIDKMILKEE